jgi:ABC-type dipeptide/oligopeptide/nickel transport system permease component
MNVFGGLSVAAILFLAAVLSGIGPISDEGKINKQFVTRLTIVGFAFPIVVVANLILRVHQSEWGSRIVNGTKFKTPFLR